MFKKAIALVLCLVMVASMLCACGFIRGLESMEWFAAEETTERERKRPGKSKMSMAPWEREETKDDNNYIYDDDDDYERPAVTTRPTTSTRPTTAPTEAPRPTTPPTTAAPPMPDWKIAYLDFLAYDASNYYAYALVYVDGDNIPELFMTGMSEADGDCVCSYKNGKVIQLHLSRTGGGSYIYKSGLIMNENGNMGYYETNIYRLSGGFTTIWTGTELLDAEGNFIYQIGGEEVSREEYQAAINGIFDRSRASHLSATADYLAIRTQIEEM